MWSIRDENGEDWELTPIIRMVKKRNGEIKLQQKFFKMVRVKLSGSNPERETRWIDVPLIKEDYRNLQEELPH